MSRPRQTETEDFIDTVANLHAGTTSDRSSHPVRFYQKAIDNKMALHFLELLNEQDIVEPLEEEYRDELNNYEQFEESLIRVATLLEDADVDYCLVKTATDYRVVPGDIDVLVFDDLSDVEELMLGREYEVSTRERTHKGPFTRNLIDNKTGFKIDLQEEMSLRKVSYIDSDNIRESIVEKTYNGTAVRAPSDEMELAIYVIHSLSEQMYVLREFFVVDSLLQQFTEENVTRFVEMIEENHLNAAVSAFFTVQAALYQRLDVQRPEAFNSLARNFKAEYGRERKKLIANDYRLPHQYTNRSILTVLKEKMHEKSFRQGWYEEISELKDPRTLGYVLKKLYERQVRTDYTSDRYSQ